ncbi:EAL domain-containing protein [Vibrio fluvialis]|uniref:EAL domain-containing protein n=1 Tax=Vibrio fluvialis TaxID=676 RepID=UPI001C9BF716|nr:EAL domain-containing protein [Vibrio fluvialis]ELD1796774.1 EAL domain-containing protein [Vibrio fluvialis]MBY7933880.1 EAL domain-containing protein [Vibrio fluvialis]MBY8257031.1 EAL domain-containing protein [Vibrio fluvialis]MBY8265448.1 EAL domain-containing protein [Vibrio fluvialis]MCE7579994.1 EAL domain-containing protein [Vibrio fluvialis]
MGEKSEHCERIVCQQCAAERALDFDFTMAFQPIIDCQAQRVFGYEALVRGLHNEPAPVVIAQVTEENRYLFDQQCRIKAISLAAKLGIDGILSINFLPNAVYQPERCIRTTLEAAKTYQFPTQNIMFEFTEGEQISDSRHIKRIIEYYQSLGFRTAIDDFGAGYSGLNLLADFQTNIVKLDMALIRNIDSDFARQAIVRHCLAMFAELNITPLAEGIETLAEYQWLKEAGISLMQGYLFAKPGFECLPAVNFIR